jgi:hypothetical protein
MGSVVIFLIGAAIGSLVAWLWSANHTRAALGAQIAEYHEVFTGNTADLDEDENKR